MSKCDDCTNLDYCLLHGLVIDICRPWNDKPEYITKYPMKCLKISEKSKKDKN